MLLTDKNGKARRGAKQRAKTGSETLCAGVSALCIIREREDYSGRNFNNLTSVVLVAVLKKFFFLCPLLSLC